jgi:hypothetical protein
MRRARRLATSTTKTEAAADRRAFTGDDLDPAEISAVLPVAPTRAHRKGEKFFAGPHAGKLRDRTGIWFLATNRLVPSDHLDDHFAFIEKRLYPKAGDDSGIRKLREILERTLRCSRHLLRARGAWRGCTKDRCQCEISD